MACQHAHVLRGSLGRSVNDVPHRRRVPVAAPRRRNPTGIERGYAILISSRPSRTLLFAKRCGAPRCRVLKPAGRRVRCFCKRWKRCAIQCAKRALWQSPIEAEAPICVARDIGEFCMSLRIFSRLFPSVAKSAVGSALAEALFAVVSAVFCSSSDEKLGVWPLYASSFHAGCSTVGGVSP